MRAAAAATFAAALVGDHDDVAAAAAGGGWTWAAARSRWWCERPDVSARPVACPELRMFPATVSGAVCLARTAEVAIGCP